jgi:hypothetical protein
MAAGEREKRSKKTFGLNRESVLVALEQFLVGLEGQI